MYILTLQITLQSGRRLASKDTLFPPSRRSILRSEIVPPELRAIIGKNELREPLGADRGKALELLPIALVKITARMDLARRALAAQLEHDGKALIQRSAPMTADEVARMHYQDRLDLVATLRDLSDFWASRSIDEGYVAQARAVAAGRANNTEIYELLGDVLDKYARRGNLSAAYGSQSGANHHERSRAQSWKRWKERFDATRASNCAMRITRRTLRPKLPASRSNHLSNLYPFEGCWMVT